MEFGIRGHLTDVITCIKCLVDRFRGYGVLTPPKLSFPIDLLRRPYNSVRTAVRHCDNRISNASFFAFTYCWQFWLERKSGPQRNIPLQQCWRPSRSPDSLGTATKWPLSVSASTRRPNESTLADAQNTQISFLEVSKKWTDFSQMSSLVVECRWSHPIFDTNPLLLNLQNTK